MYPGPRFVGFLAWWTLVGSGMARSNPGQSSINLGQTWSTSVKLGQPWENLVGFREMCPGPCFEVICHGGPSSDQAGLVRSTSFCMPTPEKIPWVKMELWQLPLLCLAFLGTRNVGQRINDLIFARSDFLGFRARLWLSRSSSRFAC